MANVVFSASANARALMVGLRKLNHSLEAYDCAPGLVPIRSRAPQPGDCLFFTDERSLAAYLGKLEFHFYPREIGFPLDDKLAFSKHLIALGFDPVPFLEIEDLDARVNFPVVLKCRYSWRAGSKLPRGAVCESREAVQEALRRFEVRGLEQGDFFLQDYLPDGRSNCFSVAGFFDASSPANSLLLVTRKIASATGALSYSLAVQVLPRQEYLRSVAMRLMTALSYTGPFELEFIQDRNSGKFYVLELNPRFWLQHSLFVREFDNALLKRYLNLDLSQRVDLDRAVLWISGVGLILSLCMPWRSSSRVLWRAIFTAIRQGEKVIVDPPLVAAIIELLRAVQPRALNRA